jgi:uncharacterized alpha-E superfamily protein
VERAVATLTLLRGTLVPVSAREASLLESLLEIADSSMTYRRRYMTTLEIAPVLDLLLADESNPRSVAFQLVRLTEHAEALPHGAAGNPSLPRTREERVLLRSLTDLRLADMHLEAKPAVEDAVNQRGDLDKMLSRLIGEIRALSDILSQNYLSHALSSRQLAVDHRAGPQDIHP